LKWFKVPKPEDPAKQFVGRTLLCYPTAQDARNRTNGERLNVEWICGNLRHPTMFQVNGSHLVSMLDAYCELNGNPLPNMETHQDFLSTVVEHIQKDQPKSLIDAKPKRPVFDG
jgi:hypothetical protein